METLLDQVAQIKEPITLAAFAIATLLAGLNLVKKEGKISTYLILVVGVCAIAFTIIIPTKSAIIGEFSIAGRKPGDNIFTSSNGEKQCFFFVHNEDLIKAGTAPLGTPNLILSPDPIGNAYAGSLPALEFHKSIRQGSVFKGIKDGNDAGQISGIYVCADRLELN